MRFAFRVGRGRSRKRRVAIIGLDSAEPSLVFGRWAGTLPHLDALRRSGFYGELESVVPAITVPAWACMTSGKDPGTLGVYGFRNRRDHSYEGLSIVTSLDIREPRLWDLLSEQGKEVIVVGVPPTYPPRPVNGSLVASFPLPSLDQEYTYPSSLKREIAHWVGHYLVDVEGFRTSDKDWLLEQIYEMTRRRFEVARRLLDRQSWDFFMMVEMGVDRIHHGFWRYCDPDHRAYIPSSPYQEVIHDYYRYLDREVGSLLERFDEETLVLVVSDHGAQRMEGGIAINQWLIREGYLALEQPPDQSGGPIRFQDLKVDWRRTRAWGEGGYYGRVFLNVKGRETQGAVEPGDYESLRDELKAGLEALGDEQGHPIGTRCFKPETIYREVRGVPPDLLVYFGDLRWRAIGTVGWDRVQVRENDTGPDDANHAQAGLWVGHHARAGGKGQRLEGLHLMQVAPTVLCALGLEAPAGMQRPPVAEVVTV